MGVIDILHHKIVTSSPITFGQSIRLKTMRIIPKFSWSMKITLPSTPSFTRTHGKIKKTMPISWRLDPIYKLALLLCCENHGKYLERDTVAGLPWPKLRKDQGPGQGCRRALKPFSKHAYKSRWCKTRSDGLSKGATHGASPSKVSFRERKASL